MRTFLFVGEKPSQTAFERGWTWDSGRLASATLHGALEEVGITEGFTFMNLFGDHPDDDETVSTSKAQARIELIQFTAGKGVTIVALGEKVAKGLEGKVDFRKLRHPAARGAGRKRELYAAHVREVLAA